MGKSTNNVVKNKISESKSIPILQYDLNGKLIKEWKSTKIAAMELKLSQGNINVCLRGKRKVTRNFIWKYKLK